VNGNAGARSGAPSSSIATYGMYVGRPLTIPVTGRGLQPRHHEWSSTGAVVDDSVYDFLAKLVDAKGAVIRIRRDRRAVRSSAGSPDRRRAPR
jgi:hypothetical protein